MWKKIGGSLILVGLCLSIFGGTSAQADTAKSTAGITFTGYYDPSKPSLPPTHHENTDPFQIGTGKTISPAVGNLPVTGDELPIKEIVGGILLCLLSLYLYDPLFKQRKKERTTSQ